MKHLVYAPFIVAISFLSAGAAWAQTPVERGMKVYTDQKCATCHAIAGKGNAKGALDDVGSRLSTQEIHDWIVMATGRRSENGLYHALRGRGVSVEAIGDAVAPRGTYEAVYEGHRAARKL